MSESCQFSSGIFVTSVTIETIFLDEENTLLYNTLKEH